MYTGPTSCFSMHAKRILICAVFSVKFAAMVEMHLSSGESRSGFDIRADLGYNGRLNHDMHSAGV